MKRAGTSSWLPSRGRRSDPNQAMEAEDDVPARFIRRLADRALRDRCWVGIDALPELR